MYHTVYRCQHAFDCKPAEIHDCNVAVPTDGGARVRKLSATLSVVDVEWPSYDAKGREHQVERSHYIVHAPKGGDARIQVLA